MVKGGNLDSWRFLVQREVPQMPWFFASHLHDPAPFAPGGGVLRLEHLSPSLFCKLQKDMNLANNMFALMWEAT